MRVEQQPLHVPVYIDAANACLRRGDQAIALTPKAFSVLRYLSEHPARLVTKQELIEAVWPRGYVTDGVLKACIHEIRKALDDEPKAPRFIETLHRRGYRLIGDLSGAGVKLPVPAPVSPSFTRQMALIGRDEVLARLEDALAHALEGRRQIVFISGEAGIGKTAVVDAFVERHADGALLVGRGQCIEHHSEGEAYLPMLEAISEICRQAPGDEVTALLARYAPSWLAHMPWLSEAASRAHAQQETLTRTRERMLREMAELLEALTAKTPLVLVLEDLHWGDYSTLDLVSMLARRRSGARLLFLITYRSVEVILTNHPLKAVKQDLQVQGLCRDLPLDYLSASDVEVYLAQRFPAHGFPPALAAFIHRRTEGNPLFMLNVVDYLMAQGAIVADQGRWALRSGLDALDRGVPESLRQMIERQIEGYGPEEQDVLEAASTAGHEFTSAVVAAALDADVIEIETRLRHLARRRQLVCEQGVAEWPDGTLSASYAFAHALYENVLYHRQSAARRMQFHRRIGVCLERAYGSRTAEIAPELALHYEQGRAYPKAVSYLRQAAASAATRYANREALDYLTRGLALPSDGSMRYELTILQGERLHDLGAMQESVAAFRAALEIASQDIERARAWMGVAASMQVMDRHDEALAALRHAEEALPGAGSPELRAQIHARRGNTYFILSDIEACLAQHEQALSYAREAGSPTCEAQALSGLGDAYYLRGRMRTAYEHFDCCIALCRRHGLGRIEVANLAMRGLTRSYQNDFRAALADCLRAVDMAVKIGDLRAEMLARDNAAALLLEQADWRGVLEHEEQSLTLARRLGTRCFEAATLGNVGIATAALGDRSKAERLLREAHAINLESGLAFSGPWVLGELALVAVDGDTRRWARAQGEKLLRADCVSHNYFYFYRDAMAACLADAQWSEVERYARALEDYTRSEPLPWSDFLIARARALAAHGRGARDEAVYRELQRLRDQAAVAGLKAALPTIETALGERR
jgi:DNA-binding winged helix-turn-helix (wHTH) protein/tetratricopeptide (TPR) repeat protein